MQNFTFAVAPTKRFYNILKLFIGARTYFIVSEIIFEDQFKKIHLTQEAVVA